MQTPPDYHLDALFRAALEEEAEDLASTAASESQMLERVGRVLARRRTRRQLVTLLLAAAIMTLTAAAIALGSRLTPPVTPERRPQTSATPGPSVAGREPSLGTELDEGPVVLWNPRNGGPPITVTIRAAGWSIDPGNRLLVKNENDSQPDGAYLHGWWTTGELYIPGDPCQWQSTLPDTPATTVDDIVAALASQASRDASGPVDVAVDGHAGQSITLHVPDDLAWAGGDFTDCDQGMFCSGSMNIEAGCFHTLYRPGQVDEMWIVDVDDQILFMEAAYYVETPAEDVDELRALLGSMTFGEPEPSASMLPDLPFPGTTGEPAGEYGWDGTLGTHKGMHHVIGLGETEIRFAVENDCFAYGTDAEPQPVTIAGLDAQYVEPYADPSVRSFSPGGTTGAYALPIGDRTLCVYLTWDDDARPVDVSAAREVVESIRGQPVEFVRGQPDGEGGIRIIFTLPAGWDTG